MRISAFLMLCWTAGFGYLEKVEPPIILAHRAGAALVPENTLQGWAEVKLRFSPHVWELDVRLSADDSLVVIHDSTVDRTTNGSGRVRDMSFEELRKLDAGFWFTPDSGETYPWRGKGLKIPTLSEAFDTFPDDNFNIEIKDSTGKTPRILVELVRKKGMEENVVVTSAYDLPILKVRELDSEIATSATPSEIRNFVLLGKFGLAYFAEEPGGPFQVPLKYGSIQVVTPGLFRRTDRRGIQVHLWTVNEAGRMTKLLKMGAEGIVTDRPDVADRVLKSLGLREFSSP